MMHTLEGKKVLITGASGGLGAAIASVFAEKGAQLALHYNKNIGTAQETFEAVRSLGFADAELFQANLLKVKECTRLIRDVMERFKNIDILINNAGAAYDFVHFSELSEQTFKNVFALNVTAPFHLIKEVFPMMKKNGGGKVINMSSVNVKYGGSAKSLHYCAAKASLESLTRGFAREGAKYNILVNAIRCGLIDTSMRKNVSRYTEKDFKERMKLVPLGRAGKPEDIAYATLFLAADTGNFITGEMFTVAGGD